MSFFYGVFCFVVDFFVVLWRMIACGIVAPERI